MKKSRGTLVTKGGIDTGLCNSCRAIGGGIIEEIPVLPWRVSWGCVPVVDFRFAIWKLCSQSQEGGGKGEQLKDQVKPRNRSEENPSNAGHTHGQEQLPILPTLLFILI